MILLFAIFAFIVYFIFSIYWMNYCDVLQEKYESKINNISKEILFGIMKYGFVFVIYLVVAYYPVQRFLDTLAS